jgi:arabinofuranosyltransferase
LVLAAMVLVRNAWIADDAYITFRTIDNFAEGFGLTWNVSERVQAYTHPLWMLVISAGHFYSGEFYYTTLLISLGASLATLAVFAFGLARSLPAAVVGLGVLILSKSFVDYSTSGLENPLTHLLLALFCLAFLGVVADEGRGLFVLCLTAGLAVLNRMDTILLFLPALAYAFWQRRSWRSLRSLVLGFAPFAAWEVFSILYYGFPFPNTAYAKLGSTLPHGELVQQGLFYLLDSVSVDPVTLVFIAAGLAAPLLVRDTRTRLVAAGIALYLTYVVWIGGDFMSGRFLSAPLLGAVILVSRLPLMSHWAVAGPALAVVIVVGGVITPHPPILSGSDYGQDYKVQKDTIEKNGISDERAFYYPVTGLLRAERGFPVPSPRQVWVDAALRVRESGPAVVVRNSVGFYGFYAGPQVHVIDELGLGDPLLARLPAVWHHEWRIGHFMRAIPGGYVDTVASGRNHLDDAALAEYYDHLSTITRGPVFSRRRFVEVVKMNLGRYDRLIDQESYRYAGMLRVDLLDRSDSGTLISVPATGVQVSLNREVHAPAIEVDVDRNHDYRLVLMRDGVAVSEQTLWALPGAEPGLITRRTDLPQVAVRGGYDTIHLLPAEGVGEPRLGHLRLVE